MIPNEITLNGKFVYYNSLYFNDLLPLPSLKTMHSYRTLGCFRCHINDDGSIVNPIIEMSDNYDYTEEQFRGVLIHEMIHYYLCYIKEDQECLHGKAFKKMSNTFKEKWNINITSSVNLSDYKPRKGKCTLIARLLSLL
jgi:hypothetical protein